MMRSKEIEPKPGRRQVLKLLSNGLVAGLGIPLACVSRSDPAAAGIPIASIPVGGRVRVLDGENPVELQRRADGAITARSLWCSHFGCEVAWSEDHAQYLCPCHEGVFDSEGRPISGPPPRALSEVVFSVREGQILIGVPDSEGAG